MRKFREKMRKFRELNNKKKCKTFAKKCKLCEKKISEKHRTFRNKCKIKKKNHPTFCEIFSFRTFAKKVSLHLFSQKMQKFAKKICEMRPKIFAFFPEPFRSLETLLITGFIYYISN